MFRCQIHNEELVETIRGEYICALCVLDEIKKLLYPEDSQKEIFEGMEIEVDDTIDFTESDDS